MAMRWMGVAVLLSGCMHFKPECHEHGGPVWYELQSTHFLVRTNLELPAAKEAALNLERARAAVLPSFPGVPAVVRPVEVLLLHNQFQLEDLVQRSFSGAFDHDWRGPLVLLSADAYLFESKAEVGLLLHELTHYLAAFSLQRQPRWFAEGLAMYLENIEIDPVLLTAHRGKANPALLATLNQWGIIPLDELWAWETPAGPGKQWHRYASAWLWVHLLINRHGPAFEDFLQRLRQGEEPKAAWQFAFAQLDPGEAEAYLLGSTISTQFFELGSVPTEVSVRTLPDAEVHAALSRAASLSQQKGRARREALAAVEMDPGNTRAREEAVFTQRDPEKRTAGARQLTVVEPTRSAGWLLLGLGLTDDAERTQALERTLELEPEHVIALAALARSRGRAQRHPEAVELAQRAVALAPYDSRVLSVLAGVLRDAGQCERALHTQRRAIELLPHRAPDEVRSRMQTELEASLQCK